MALRSSQSSITQQVILEWIEKGKSPSSMIGNVERLGDAIKSLNAKALNSILAEYNKRVKVAQERASTPSERLAAPGQAWGAMTGGGAKKYAGKTIEQLVAKTQEQYAGYERFFRMVESGTKKYMKDWDSAIKEDHRRTQQMIKNGQMVARANQENLKFDEKAQQAVLTGAQKRFAFQENLQRQGARQEADRQAAFRQEQIRQDAIQKYGQMMAYAQQQNIKLDEASQKSVMQNAQKRARLQENLQRQGMAQEAARQAALKKNAELVKKAYDATPVGMLTRAFEKFGTVFSRVTDALVSFQVINFVANAVRGFFTTIVSSNAQLEVMDARLSAISRGGGSFETLRNSIIQLTVTTPFVIADLIEATAKLEGFGVSAQKYLPKVADWATAMGRDIQDMAVAFAKISIGSPRTSMLLGTRGISMQVFRKELERTGSEAIALANIIDRYFGGMAERVSRTFSGLVSNIKDMWFMLSTSIGSDLFIRLRRDIELLYKEMSKLKDVGQASLRIQMLSVALGQLYEVLTSAAPWLAILAGIKVLEKFKIALTGVAQIVKVSATGLSTFLAVAVGLSEAYKWAEAWGRIGESFANLKEVMATETEGYTKRIDALELSLRRVAELTEGSIMAGPVAFYRALKRVIEEANKSQSNFIRNIGFTLDVLSKLARVMPGVGPWYMFIEGLLAASKAAEKLKRELESLRAAETALMEIQSTRIEGSELLDLRKQFEKGGGMSFLKNELAELQSLMAVAGFGATQPANTAIETALASLADLSGGSIADLEKKVGEAYRKGIEKARGKLISNATPESAKHYRDLLADYGQFLATMAEKGGKSTQQYADEIREAQTRLRELATGESQYTARIEGSKSRILELQQQINALVDKGIDKESTIGEMGRLRKELLQEEVSMEENKARIKERSATAELRLLEARRGLAESETSLIRRNAEFEYEFSGNLEGLNRARAKGLELINSRINEITGQIGEQEYKARQASFLGDPTALKNAQAEIAELQKEKNKYLEEELNLWADLYNRVSEDFPAAFAKTFRVLRNGLNDFYDEFTDLFVSGIRETTTGIIMDLLYGESGKSGLSEARYELASIRAEMSQAAYESSQIRRREGETNEEYAARMQLFEGAAASQQQMYVFKTQELEQMERINELERERNNLIYDRLRALGQKLTEKLMDYAIGSLMNMAFQGLSGPNYRDPGMVEAGYPGNNRPSSGGNTYVISGNTIYGMDDFDRKVGDSIRRIETRQRA